MSLHMTVALAGLEAVPATIALVSGAKDAPTRTICGVALAVSLVIALAPYTFLDSYISGNLMVALEVVAGVVGIIAAVRVPNRVLGTLMVTGGGLLALRALGLLS